MTVSRRKLLRGVGLGGAIARVGLPPLAAMMIPNLVILGIAVPAFRSAMW